MKKNLLLLLFVFVLVSCVGNNTKKDRSKESAALSLDSEIDNGMSREHNARNSLSYAGVYEGTIPCADCPGIDVVLTLDYEGNYVKKMAYQDRTPQKEFTRSGKFTWDDSGFIITLTGDGDMYKVREGSLVLLDQEGKEITGANSALYVLTQK